MNKPIMFWKVGDTYYKDYDKALSILSLCKRDLEENGIEND